MYVHIRIMHVALQPALPRVCCGLCPKIPLNLGLAKRVGGQVCPLSLHPSLLSLHLTLRCVRWPKICGEARRGTRFAQEISEGNQAVTVANFNYLECVCRCVCVCVCVICLLCANLSKTRRGEARNLATSQDAAKCGNTFGRLLSQFFSFDGVSFRSSAAASPFAFCRFPNSD